MRRSLRRYAYAALGAAALVLSACSGNPRVVLDTAMGEIEVEVYEDKAPISAADFLLYVDEGLYDAQGFYRVVRPENDPREMNMQLIQGGRLDSQRVTSEIAHEPTSETGLSHQEGTISIAREAVGSGSAAYFFITIGDNSFLDHGGARNPDGQGYAAFGKVVKGMDVVRAIQALPSGNFGNGPETPNQYLEDPILIKKAYRK